MEHRYDDLLKTIIYTVKNDYAGFQEKKERHDSRYYVNTTGTAFKQGVLDERLFLRIVCQYLASLGDPNLKFSMVDHGDYQNYTVGFRTRRYEQDLYVTECEQDQRLKVGDRITSINHLPAGEHRKKFRKNILIGNTAEREQWSGFLKMADHFVVEHVDGSTEDLSFAHFPMVQPQRRLEFRAFASGDSAGITSARTAATDLRREKEKIVSADDRDEGESFPDTCYLCVEEFSADTNALESLLTEHETELRSCTNLIIDIRKNEGGVQSGFAPLLPLMSDRTMSLQEMLSDEAIDTNYTKENCERRITEFRAMKAMCAKDGNEAAAQMCEDLIREFREKSGTGLCRETEDTIDVEADLLWPYANIKKVVLITDTWCRDAGEVFVKLATKSSKVTVLGRPTMGTIDYTNSVTMVLDQTFVLSYPMSRREHVADGTCYNDTGLPVDIYVPWTPQECTEDVLLAKALEIL